MSLIRWTVSWPPFRRKIALSPELSRLRDRLFSAPLIDDRAEYARAMGRLGDVAAIPTLLDLYADPKLVPAMEDAIQKGLLALGPSAAGPLIRALKHRNVRLRLLAADTLGKLNVLSAVKPLIWSLEDRTVCDRSARALGKLGDRQAVQPLIQLMAYSPCGGGAAALAELGDRAAVATLIAAIKMCETQVDWHWPDRLRGDPSAWDVEQMFKALGELGGPAACNFLVVRAQSNDHCQTFARRALTGHCCSGMIEALLLARDSSKSAVGTMSESGFADIVRQLETLLPRLGPVSSIRALVNLASTAEVRNTVQWQDQFDPSTYRTVESVFRMSNLRDLAEEQLRLRGFSLTEANTVWRNPEWSQTAPYQCDCARCSRPDTPVMPRTSIGGGLGRSV